MEILMQTTTNPTTTTMATAAVLKPKERQFQVVPVPAIFTRGRWECRDFKEVTSVENQILEFVEKQQAIAASNVSTSTVIPVIPIPVVSTTTISEAQIPQKIVILPNTTGNNTSSLITTNTVYNTNDNGSTNIIDNSSSISSTNTITNGNIVAIDNKIEQAMDLVKTHLTFAVREEVEILRSTISDLEIRVNQLDNENQILRQFAPTEVVNNIALLMQQQQKNSQQQQQQIAIDQQQQQPLQQLPPPPLISSVQQTSLIHESSQPS